MGMFGNKKKFDWTGAALGFFNPEAAQMYNRHKAAGQQKEQDLMRELDLRSGLEREGYLPHQIDGLVADRMQRPHLFEKPRPPSGYSRHPAGDAIDAGAGQITQPLPGRSHDGAALDVATAGQFVPGGGFDLPAGWQLDESDMDEDPTTRPRQFRGPGFPRYR